MKARDVGKVTQEWLEVPGAFEAMRKLIKLRNGRAPLSGYAEAQEQYLTFLRAWLIERYPDAADAVMVRDVYGGALVTVEGRMVK